MKSETIELHTHQGSGEAERVRVAGVRVWLVCLPDRSFYWFGSKASLLKRVDRINRTLEKEEKGES